jgi:hypothetical protein
LRLDHFTTGGFLIPEYLSQELAFLFQTINCLQTGAEHGQVLAIEQGSGVDNVPIGTLSDEQDDHINRPRFPDLDG